MEGAAGGVSCWHWAAITGLCVLLPPVRLSRDRSGLQVQSREMGAWAWACHDTFTPEMAVGACKQLGYPSR